MLLGGWDDNQSRRFAYQTSRGALSVYIQRYILDFQDSNWQQSKNISGCSTVCIGSTKFAKRFQLRSDDHDHQKTRTEKAMKIDHIRPHRKCFLCHRGHFARHCKSISVNAIALVKEPKTGEIGCWRCGEGGHLKRRCPKNSRLKNQQHTKDLLPMSARARTRETITPKP